MTGGKRVARGEKVRLPLGDARHLEKVRKAKLVKGTEKEQLI